MRHFAFHTLQRLIPFGAPEVAQGDAEVDGFWLKSVWPIIQTLDERRFLREGRSSLERPYVRPVRIARTNRVRIDVGLFFPNDPNRFAFSEEQVVSLAEMEFKVYWPGVPVAWKAFTVDELLLGLTAVLELFPGYRLECRTGPDRRIDLRVPFDRNGEAKFYFAKWDPVTTYWYVPECLWNVGLEQFALRKATEIIPACHASGADSSGPHKR
jgi:hypothetical protein